MAPKRQRKSSAPPVAASASRSSHQAAAKQNHPESPLTRSRTKAARTLTVEEDKDDVAATKFLTASDFQESLHVPALYRLSKDDPVHTAPSIREKGDPPVKCGDFPNPFTIVDLNDKHGVWQKEPPLVKTLGEDPGKRRREAIEGKATALAPAGLKNLGATCYINSLLQYLFFNADFRRSLLAAPSESDVVRALQKIFALLEEGQRNEVDTSEFVQAARVDAVEQADATEFSALLLDFLQRELGQAKGPDFIAALFQGEFSQLLSCKEDPSHRFERRESFYELRARLTPTSGTEPAATPAPRTSGLLPVVVPLATAGELSAEAPAHPSSKASGAGRRGSASKRKLPIVRLESLLADTAFPEEMLNGSNQYHCERCNKKVDACRSIHLAKLPPYLNVTVERYHYDLQKGERRKLNHPVSFPRRLELRICEQKASTDDAADPTSGATSSEASAKPVVYECIGYLEHVSESAHSGHYTATLLQEDAGEVAQLASEADEPAAKRQCCDGTRAAASAQQKGTWWTLDDTTVAPIAWDATAKPEQATGIPTEEQANSRSPERIESAAAYLVLYRRRDHKPGQLHSSPGIAGDMSSDLVSAVTEANASFEAEVQEYETKSSLVEAFVSERRRAVQGFVEALRKESAARKKAGAASGAGGAAAFSFVPTSWLTAFLRGEDRSIDELVSGEMSLSPVMYGRSILGARNGPETGTIDPLASWCGEMKLVPTAVLEELTGNGGLDASLFLSGDTVVAKQACESAWRIFHTYCEEQQHLAKVLKDGRIGTKEAAQLPQPDDAVWVATRVLNVWKKAVVGGASADKPPSLRELWQGFLEEVRTTRWGSSAASTGVEPDAAPKKLEGADAQEQETKSVEESNTPSTLLSGQLNLLGDLLCSHGLVARVRAGFLLSRYDCEKLLALASAKEKAYSSLWPEARNVPRLRSGLPNGSLLGLNDVCSECRGMCAQNVRGSSTSIADGPERKHGADGEHVPQRNLVVKRRYSSGACRKQGNIKVPATGPGITAEQLAALVLEKFSTPVLHLFLPESEETGPETELLKGEPLPAKVNTVVFEKDEAAQPEREAAAFAGSVFRSLGS